MNDHGEIAVLIDARLHNELVLRRRRAGDVSHIVENVLSDFLERTEGDTDLWNEDYVREWLETQEDDHLERYGPPDKGHHWKNIVLHNGAKLKITYKNRDHFAEIRHGRIMDGKYPRTPSEWANCVANHTSRNAWRDIYVQQPGTTKWVAAQVMRYEAKRGLGYGSL